MNCLQKFFATFEYNLLAPFGNTNQSYMLNTSRKKLQRNLVTLPQSLKEESNFSKGTSFDLLLHMGKVCFDKGKCKVGKYNKLWSQNCADRSNVCWLSQEHFGIRRQNNGNIITSL